MNCVYCYDQRRDKIIGAGQKKQTARFLKTPGKEKEIVFFGGEPLLKPKRLKALVVFAKNQGATLKKTVKLSLCTNLTVFNLELLRQFDYIYVSLDGARKSHDFLRQPANFSLVLNNLRRLKKNKKLWLKIRLNKIIHPQNVKFLVSDFLFLQKTKLSLNFSFAAGVAGWDEKSLALLRKNLQKVCQILEADFKQKKKDFTRYEFLRLPAAFCPFSSPTMAIDGNLVNCEFMALANLKLISQKKDIRQALATKRCTYDLTTLKCLYEKCLRCGFVCRCFDLSAGKKLDKEDTLNLKKAQNYKSLFLKKFIQKQQVKIPTQIIFRNCQEGNRQNAVNFIALLCRFLKSRSETTILTNLTKDNIIKKLIKNFPGFSLEQGNNENIKVRKNTLIFNCNNGDVYLAKNGLLRLSRKEYQTTNFIGNLKTGISIIDLVEK